MPARETVTLGGATAAPGTRATGHIDSVELADGTHVRIPVILVNGAGPGPTVFIGAGAHGDEINGIRAVIDAVNAVDPATLRGTIIAVPVQNPLTFRSRERLVRVNQLDEQNMHRTFPGSPGGDISARTANLILADIVEAYRCDFVLDYHTGSTGSYCPPHSFLSTIGDADTVAKSIAAAEAFNAGITIQAGSEAGVYALANMLHMVAVERGIPAIGCELGTALPAEKTYSDIGTEGALNVFAQLGMIDRELRQVRDEVVVSGIVDVRAPVGGICDYQVQPGDALTKGQPLLKVTSVLGEERDIVVSPVEGVLVTLCFYGSINEGERVARIGVA